MTVYNIIEKERVGGGGGEGRLTEEEGGLEWIDKERYIRSCMAGRREGEVNEQ